MSENQYVLFRAVDAPLNGKQLAFAERQSTRADVSRWWLAVDYHYRSFRGDVDGLLRRGYDVFLDYANYGVREIKLRLPHGMPADKTVWSHYADGEQVKWKKDSERFANSFGAFALGDDGNDLNAQGNDIIEAIANEEFSDEQVEDLIGRFKSRVNAWLEMLERRKNHVGR